MKAKSPEYVPQPDLNNVSPRLRGTALLRANRMYGYVPTTPEDIQLLVEMQQSSGDVVEAVSQDYDSIFNFKIGGVLWVLLRWIPNL